MALIAKRGVMQTWRDAVAARAHASGLTAESLAAFDRRREAGASEAEAAYRALEQLGLLWTVELPGERSQTVALAPRVDAPRDVPAA